MVHDSFSVSHQYDNSRLLGNGLASVENRTPSGVDGLSASEIRPTLPSLPVADRETRWRPRREAESGTILDVRPFHSHITHFISSHLISDDLISCETTEFAVAATNSNEVASQFR